MDFSQLGDQWNSPGSIHEVRWCAAFLKSVTYIVDHYASIALELYQYAQKDTTTTTVELFAQLTHIDMVSCLLFWVEVIKICDVCLHLSLPCFNHTQYTQSPHSQCYKIQNVFVPPIQMPFPAFVYTQYTHRNFRRLYKVHQLLLHSF